MRKIYILLLLIVCQISLTACENVDGQVPVTDEQPKPDDDNGGSGDNNDNSEPDPVIVGPKVCYQPNSNCMPVFHKDKVTTPGEYNYKNPTGHFSSTLARQYQAPTYFVDLENDLNSAVISKNFKTSEYMQAYKGRYAIYSPYVTDKIQQLRDRLGKAVKVNSAYRGPAYNKKIGGATWSRHMYGDAIDFAVSGVSPQSLKKYCEDLGASFIQVYVSHIHCDWRLAPLPSEFYNTGAGQITALSKAMPSLKAELHEHYHHDIQIYIDGELAVGKSVLVGIESYASEEAAPLYTEWKVYKNGELVFESKKPIFKISDLKSGEYEIHANVGGYWQKAEGFAIK